MRLSPDKIGVRQEQVKRKRVPMRWCRSLEIGKINRVGDFGGKVQMVRGLAQPFAARLLDNSLALMTVPKCETWTPYCNNRAWLNVNKPGGKTG